MRKPCMLIGLLAAVSTAQAKDAKDSTPAWTPPALLAPEDVRLSGAWATAQARNAARLAAAPLDKPEFVLDDVALKMNRKFANYSGDISGRWIGAGAFLAGQYPQDFAALPGIVAAIPGYQKADGHFGAEQHLPQIERQRDMPILWGNGRLLIGLVEVYERTGDQAALAAAKKLGDYFVATDAIYDKPENLKSVGGTYADGFATCYFSCIEGLAGLARVTKDPRYLTQAARIADLALVVDNFDGLHSHGRLCAARGFADLFLQTGDRHWREAAARDWTIFRERHRLPTGGIQEVLDAKCQRDEGCAVADWLRLNLSLWRATGEGRYLDEAQRCLNNHFSFGQFPNGGAGHRVLQLIGGQPVAFKALSEEAWWCCGEHWARGLVDVARFAVTPGAQGPSVNLAIDCDASVPGANGPWKTSVRETADGLRITVQPAKATRGVVTIHRPAWATGATLDVPKGCAVQEANDAWLVRGNWKDAQQVTVHWPLTVRQEAAPGGAVLLGAHDLLAAHRVLANAWLTDVLPGARPTVLWHAALTLKDGRVLVPATLAAEADPNQAASWKTLELAPLRNDDPAHEVAWFSFNVQSATPAQIAAVVSPAR